ncbi:MAG: TIGR03663 family protein [Chloroflexi bacterium]|nr:TIGR03663 family protein [Chloroflexota bacterium]
MSANAQGIGSWLGRPAWFGWTRGEWLLYAVILAVAAGLRFFDLGERVYHHDEAIHAKESNDMINGKQFRYDPAYHGPLLYFGNVIVFLAAGVTDALGRVIPALFGVASVGALLILRPELGRTGTPLAMAAMTVSTSFLYYSRFLRMDIYVALFTLLLVGSVMRYLERPQRRWIYLAWATLGLSLATKENTFIHGFALLVVLIAVGGLAFRAARRGPDASPLGTQALDAFRSLGYDVEHVVYGALTFVLIVFAFYTSFLTHLPGFRAAFTSSIEYWTSVHESERVNQPWFYYAMFLGLYEPFALVVGAVALVRGRSARHLLPFVLGVWIVVTWIVYSAAGEKAPWLVLHLLWPPMLLACWWVGRWFDEPRPRIPRLVVGVLSAGLLFWTVWFAIPITYERGSVPNDLVVYVQSTDDVKVVAAIADEAARRTGQGDKLSILIDNNYAWPTVWYLRDYKDALYTKDMNLEDAQEAQIVLMSPSSADTLGIQLPEYVGRRMKLRWWFPEYTYKSWDLGFLSEFLADPEARRSFLHWLVTREEPPVPKGSYDFMLYVRTDLLKDGPLGPFRL